LYALREHRKAQALVWAAWVLFADLGSVVWLLQSGWGLGRLLLTYYQWMEVFAAPLMLLYNGQRGAGHKKLFYWFYPAHVYVLDAASCAVMRFGGGENGPSTCGGRRRRPADGDRRSAGPRRPLCADAGRRGRCDRGPLPLGRPDPAGLDDARGGRRGHLPPHPGADRRAHPLFDRPQRRG